MNPAEQAQNDQPANGADSPPPHKRRWPRILLLVWLGLLVLSNLSPFTGIEMSPPALPGEAGVPATLTLPEMTDHGPRPDGRSMRLASLRWTPKTPVQDRPPVILIHGCPGGADDFARFGPRLADFGYDTIAFDMPGFGSSERWVGDYSILASARLILAAMDSLGIRRAHIVGWSLGGGTAQHIADLAPDRLASLTLMASIGAQEAEGSGNYFFEHFKYAVGFVFAVAIPELIPHFGMLGERSFRHAAVRSFWDSDQRPLRDILTRIRTPTLILHGRDDPLVPAWGAELHHRLIPASRLVMLDASHFLPLSGEMNGKPFGQASLSAAVIAPFLSRHDTPGVAPLVGVADFSPREEKEKSAVGPFEIARGTPWWLIILLIILATFITEDGTVIAVGLAIAHNQIDWGVGFIGCLVGIAAGDGGLYLIGRVFGRRALRWPFLRSWLPEKSLDRWGRWFDRHTIQAVFLARAIPGTRFPTYLAAGLLSQKTHGFLLWAGIAAFVWTPFILIMVGLLGPGLFDALRSVFSGPVAVVAAIILLFILFRSVGYLVTWEGRRRLRRELSLPFRSEFWPPWIFYPPLIPLLFRHAMRSGGPMTFTCMNPGVPHGGGVVGESKHLILSKLSDAELIIPTVFIPPGEDADLRAARVDALLRDNHNLGGYPAVVKPDEGQRGHAVRIIRSIQDARAYFDSMTRAAILQRYHPGPHEIGVTWSRVITEPGSPPSGRIFSITRKDFQSVTGDGVTPLDRLIWKHPRFRMQADTFLKRFDAIRDRVLAKGESMRLAEAGNHCQGTLFRDGADLITPQLEARINAIALSYENDAFDFGRFDLRYADELELRAGRGFSVIELNGATGESTNIYDPSWSIWRRYRVLIRQWRLMYDLGAWRRRSGARPMAFRELLDAMRGHFRGRPGSSVSD